MKIKLLLTLIFFSQIIFAQDVLIDATVVTLSQDSLKGKIKYNNWELNPTKIEFVTTNNVTIFYKPDDIKSFKITENGEVYVSKMVKLDYFWQSDIAEHQSALAESKSENVFLRLLLKGNKASLYQLNDKDNRIRFFTEKNNQTYELVNYIYRKIVDTQGDKKLMEFKKEIYKNQIPLICEDAPKNILKGMPMYEQSSMMNFFRKYNDCFLGDKVVFEAKKDKLKFAVIPFVGGAYYPNLVDRDVSSVLQERSWKPSFNISIQMLEPRKNYNRFVRLDAQYISSVKYYYLINKYIPVISQRTKVNISLTGGSYFGKENNKVRPYAFGGGVLTPATILFIVGGGFTYQKNLHIEYTTSFYLLNQVSVGYRINLGRK